MPHLTDTASYERHCMGDKTSGQMKSKFKVDSPVQHNGNVKALVVAFNMEEALVPPSTNNIKMLRSAQTMHRWRTVDTPDRQKLPIVHSVSSATAEKL